MDVAQSFQDLPTAYSFGVEARVWKRCLEDLFDSSRYQCCAFFPSGDKWRETIHSMFDPKSQYVVYLFSYTQEPVAVNIFLAGQILLDGQMPMAADQLSGQGSAALGQAVIPQEIIP